MSNIAYTEAFQNAVNPTEEEIWAFRSTLQAMDIEFGNIATGVVDTLKARFSDSGICHLTADLPNIQLGFDNWWKHILRERITQDVIHEFGESANLMLCTALDLKHENEHLQVDLRHVGTPITTYYDMNGPDKIDAYPELQEGEGFKSLRSLVNRIGGIEMCVLVNASAAGVQSSSGRRPQIPTFIMSTRDDTPLMDKIRRYEEFGPVH